ncbi:hypothetical protein ACQJBY_032516 [Aegilops geniculata]
MTSIWKRRGPECGLDLEKGRSRRAIPAHSDDSGGHLASSRALLSLAYHLH